MLRMNKENFRNVLIDLFCIISLMDENNFWFPSFCNLYEDLYALL